MNVYDFDKTILRGDSTKLFYAWCLGRYPRIARFWPRLGVDFVRWKCGIIDKTAFKQRLFAGVTSIGGMRAEVDAFWRANENRVYDWYRKQKRSDDVIISASPLFLIRPVCDRLGVRVIASNVDPDTGRFDGPNCYGPEKVTRFRALYPNAVIDAFYSDSRTDAPMAQLARRAFFIREGVPEVW